MSRGTVVLVQGLTGVEHQLVVVGSMKHHTRHPAHMLQTPLVVDRLARIVERLEVGDIGSVEDRSHSARHMGR
jgi:hypothetical protein